MTNSVFERPITIGCGTGPIGYDWKNVTGGVMGHLFATLSRPLPQHEKEGLSFIQGALNEGCNTRKGVDVASFEIIAFDVESGESPDPIVKRLTELGWAGIVIPTFKHGMRKTAVTLDGLRSWKQLGSEDEVDASVASAWFATLPYASRVNAKPPVLVSEHIVGKYTKRRVPAQFVFAHDPLPRFRVIVALNRRLPIGELGASLAEQSKKWRAIYRFVAQQLSIEQFDAACTDVNRLYYFHRRPKGAETWCHRTDGVGVDVDVVLASLDVKDQAKRTHEGTDDTSHDAQDDDEVDDVELDEHEGDPEQRERFHSFWKTFRHRLNAGEALEALGTNSNVKADGKTEAKCPFEDQHASADAINGRPCCAYDAHVAQHGTATIMCHHNTCKRRRSIEFAWALLRPLSVDDWRNFLSDEGQKTFAIWRKTLRPTEKEIAAKVAQLSRDSSDRDVSEVIKLLSRRPRGAFQTSMVRAIADNTRWPKGEIDKALKAESKSFEEERQGAEEKMRRQEPSKERKDKDLPPGFWRHNGKICHRRDKLVVWVTDDFVVTARVRDEHANSWGTEIAFTCDGKSRSLVIFDRELQKDDDALRARLADAGLKVHTETKPLFRVLMNGLSTDRRLMRVSVPGWHATVFHSPNNETVKE